MGKTMKESTANMIRATGTRFLSPVVVPSGEREDSGGAVCGAVSLVVESSKGSSFAKDNRLPQAGQNWLSVLGTASPHRSQNLFSVPMFLLLSNNLVDYFPFSGIR